VNAPATLLDRYLPAYDVREQHQTRVRVPPEQAYAAFRALCLDRSLLVRALFGLRTLPARLSGHPAAPLAPAGTPFVDVLLATGWRVLEERPGGELVLGVVTQPWTAAVRFTGLPGPEFVAFRRPGFTKIAVNLAVRALPDLGTVVSTETRVAATDPAARRRFRRYWLLVRPGVRLVRRLMLAELRRALRHPAPPRPAPRPCDGRSPRDYVGRASDGEAMRASGDAGSGGFTLPGAVVTLAVLGLAATLLVPAVFLEFTVSNEEATRRKLAKLVEVIWRRIRLPRRLIVVARAPPGRHSFTRVFGRSRKWCRRAGAGRLPLPGHTRL
jgi:hypothetical protein